MNTIHLLEGWQPNYYVTVDQRVRREFGRSIEQRFGSIPKFVPMPQLEDWRGENFYHFLHRPGELWQAGQSGTWQKDILTKTGITFHSCMHVAMQLAYYMGFTILLMIGVEHKPNAGREHFWGVDHGMPEQLPINDWLKGYKILVERFAEHGVDVKNISANTYVPEDVLPRDDWRNYENKNA